MNPSFLFFAGWTFAFGLVVGSFLNVCIYRLPLGQSVVTPRSHCPQCGRFLKWYDNIPVVSYALLGGRCRSCKKSISMRYSLVEVITGALSLGVFLRFGFTWGYFFFFVLLAAPLIAITFIDLGHRIIPDSLSLTGIVSGIAANVVLTPSPIWESALFSFKGILAGGGTLFLISVLYEKLRHQEGIGGGDVKLAAMLGAFFGWKGVFVVLLLSSFLGSVIGLGLMVFSKKNLKLEIPYGPFLSAAALVYLFYGPEIIDFYIEFSSRMLIQR